MGYFIRDILPDPSAIVLMGSDKKKIDRLYQWDQNIKVMLTDWNLDNPPIFYFCNRREDEMGFQRSEEITDQETGKIYYVAEVPNRLLEVNRKISCFIATINPKENTEHPEESELNSEHKTIYQIDFDVVARAKPLDYIEVDNTDYISIIELNQRLDSLINTIQEKLDGHEFDGFSPTVELEREQDGVNIVVTNKDGQTSKKVYDGKDAGEQTIEVNWTEISIEDYDDIINLTGKFAFMQDLDSCKVKALNDIEFNGEGICTDITSYWMQGAINYVNGTILQNSIFTIEKLQLDNENVLKLSCSNFLLDNEQRQSIELILTPANWFKTESVYKDVIFFLLGSYIPRFPDDDIDIGNISHNYNEGTCFFNFSSNKTFYNLETHDFTEIPRGFIIKSSSLLRIIGIDGNIYGLTLQYNEQEQRLEGFLLKHQFATIEELAQLRENIETKETKTELVGFNTLTITLVDNTFYYATELVGNLSIVVPNNIEKLNNCSLVITTGATPNVTIASGTIPIKWHGEIITTFEANTTYELNFRVVKLPVYNVNNNEVVQTPTLLIAGGALI